MDRSFIQITENPIFVLGAPRSGTSMMQWALRQHPTLWGGPESDFMVPLVEALRGVHECGSRRNELHWLSGRKVGLDEFLRFMGLGLNALYTQRSGGLRWVEQTPQYTLHMDDILQLFPGVVFIMMLRDGRDVVESLKNFVNPVKHLEASRLWARFVSVGLDFATGPHRDRVHAVRYRDAVDNTEATMAGIFTFLGIEESPDSVASIMHRDPINSSFGAKESEAQSIRWESWSAEERGQFNEAAGEVLIQMGFESDDCWVSG